MTKRISLQLSANYISIFLVVGIIGPYWGIWLSAHNLSSGEIGMIIAVPHIMKIIVAPLVSQIADKHKQYWLPLALCTGISLILYSFYFFSDSLWSIFIITIAVNLFMPAMLPLLETITIGQAKKHDLNYGKIRALGSASFIFTSVLFGWILKNNSENAILLGIYACLVINFAAVFFLPRGNRKLITGSNEKLIFNSPIKILINNKDFVLFLFAVGFIQMSHGLFYAMGSIHWHDNGIAEDVIGILWGVGVISEIIVFIFLGQIIRKINLHHTIIILGLLGVLRWWLMGFSISLPLLFMAQIIHGFTYGASHLAAIYYLGNQVPTEYAATAQSLYTALPLGLGMAFSTYFGSILYGFVGGQSYYAMSLLCIFAIFISIFSSFVAKSGKNARFS